MKKYKVVVRTESYEIYLVKADTPEEATRLAYEGDGVSLAREVDTFEEVISCEEVK